MPPVYRRQAFQHISRACTWFGCIAGGVVAVWALCETASCINAVFAAATVALVFASIGFAIRKVERARFLNRLKTMRYLVCLNCRYELGETQTRCPECGRKFETGTQEQLWRRSLSLEGIPDDDQAAPNSRCDETPERDR
jgi:hypothetical protein